MGSDNEFEEVSALLRAARRRIIGIPESFDLDALLAISLSESDRLAQQTAFTRPKLGSVQVILSKDKDAPEPPKPARPKR